MCIALIELPCCILLTKHVPYVVFPMYDTTNFPNIVHQGLVLRLFALTPLANLHYVLIYVL